MYFIILTPVEQGVNGIYHMIDMTYTSVEYINNNIWLGLHIIIMYLDKICKVNKMEK